MNLLLLVLLNLYFYNLYFFFNEEVLLFFTFSLFFFISIKALNWFIWKWINFVRYKIYNKFVKMAIFLLKGLHKNKRIFRVFFKVYLTNFIFHYAIWYFPDFRIVKLGSI